MFKLLGFLQLAYPQLVPYKQPRFDIFLNTLRLNANSSLLGIGCSYRRSGFIDLPLIRKYYCIAKQRLVVAVSRILSL